MIRNSKANWFGAAAIAALVAGGAVGQVFMAPAPAQASCARSNSRSPFHPSPK